MCTQGWVYQERLNAELSQAVHCADVYQDRYGVG